MHCDTSTRPVFDLTQYKAPRALHNELVRFIRGIRGPRKNAVTRKQIGDWCSRTPAEAVDAALVDLIAEGKITACALSLRTPRNATKRAVGYEVVRDEPQNEDGGDVAQWWFFHAPDTSDIRALEERIDKAIADAQERERAFWRGLNRVPTAAS